MKQIYICEDTITGIYSALHDAWKECRDTQAGVELRGRTQRQLFCEYRIVEESEEKALRLERMIKHHLGYNAYWEIYHALLSTDDRKGTVVFEVLQEARKIRQSEKIMEHLGCPMKRIDMKNLFVSENLKTEFCFQRLLRKRRF